MRRRSLVTFVVLNVLISLGVALAVISTLGPQNQGGSQQVVITVPILVTATQDPNATRDVIIITATPQPGSQQAVALPTGLLDGASLSGGPLATLDPQLLASDVSLQLTATALPQNCIPYVVKSGDTPFGIAVEYNADAFQLMEVNGLDDVAASNLQIGDSLIIPLEGCALTAADVSSASVEDEDADAETTEDVDETEAVSQTRTPAPTARPTVTIPPTAENAQVVIRNVRDSGDMSAEAVEIQNNGATVDLQNWTLSDADGNEYTFAQQRLFSGGSITLNTRAGQNTPVVLFWGQTSPVWQSGDVVTLSNAQGQVQSTFRVP
jgi:LysM repeat protein